MRRRAGDLESTDRTLAEKLAELEAANRELEAFSYSVSHDLRAPLRTISAFTQALAQDLRYQLDDRTRDHLRRVLAATARMNDHIDALLALSQIANAQLGRRAIDLSVLACAVLDELKRRDVSRRVVVRVQRELVVYADARLVRIVLEHLLGNAYKFTSRSPRARIEVGADLSSGELAYYVRDNGVGFDMRDAHRLFAPFQRLHADRELVGAGIGLATARRIVERHGGRIWAIGVPGEGATFFFTLPK